MMNRRDTSAAPKTEPQQPKEAAEQVIGGMPAVSDPRAVATFDRFLPKSFTELQVFAEIISKTDFCPKEYKGKPHDVLAVFMFCGELDVKFMQGLYGIFVVNGKPAAYGDLFLAICMHHPDFDGLAEWYDDATQTAHCIAKRRGRADVHQTFSEEDVKQARLRDKTGSLHVTYPRRMKQMRARGFACRDQFADALKGMVIAEEAHDMRDISGEVINQASPAPGESRSRTLLNQLKPAAPATTDADQVAAEPKVEEAPPAKVVGPTEAELLAQLEKAKAFDEVNMVIDLARDLDPDAKQKIGVAARARIKELKGAA